jgi:protein gp37
MSDLFHEKVSFSHIKRVFDVIKQAHHHTFQILTQRAERTAAFCRGRTVPPNAWLGGSVENRKYCLPRIDMLRGIDATIRYEDHA